MPSPFRSRVARAVAALALALPFSAAAQGIVAGTVVSAAGAPLAGTRVTVPTLDRSAVTDARGAFRLAGLPAGPVQLRAERIGFGAADVAAQVADGAEARVQITLRESAVALGGVVVSATREARLKSQTPASVGTVTGAELRAVRPTHPSEILGRIPGVWVAANGGEGHQTAIRQPKSTKPMYLFLEDGVPTRSTGFFNHNALYEINVPQAERVEVLKGPATALYGSDAIGGVVNVETRRASLRPQLEGSVEGGSNAWRRVLLSGSGTLGQNGVRADLNVTSSDGFRDATAYDRTSATLRWDRYLPANTTLRTVATWSSIDQTDGSTITAEDFRARSPVNYNPVARRQVQAFRASAALERPFADGVVSLTSFVRDNSMTIVPSWMLSFDPVTYTTGHRSVGMLARARHDLPFMDGSLIAGADLEYSPGFRRENRIAVTRQGGTYASFTEGERIYDYDVAFVGASPYLQAELAPAPRLKVSLGMRYDRVGYDYDNHLDTTSAGRWRRPADASPRYGHLSPKLGATYEAARALNLFASARHGFRAPSEGQLFRQGSSRGGVGLQPVKANSFEAGARGAVGRWLSYEASASRMEVEDDILTLLVPAGNGFDRVNENAGRTRHQGVEVGVGLALSRELQVDGSYSNAVHRYLEWTPSATESFDGKRMESAPRVLANARMTYAPRWASGARVAGEWSRTGGYFTDAANTHRYGGHALVSLRAAAPLGRALELNAAVQNVFDARYADGATYSRFEGERFTPGAPRSVSLSVQYRWQR
jgi:outer membrane receptor protein involved in Fe transport